MPRHLHYYDRALELAPENIDVLVNKAVTLYNNRQRNDEVMVICDQALQIQPYNARMLYMKGTVLKTMGKVSEAKAYLDKASELDPKFENSLNDFQPISKAVFEKPISYYDKALEIDPSRMNDLKDLRRNKYLNLHLPKKKDFLYFGELGRCVPRSKMTICILDL